MIRLQVIATLANQRCLFATFFVETGDGGFPPFEGFSFGGISTITDLKKIYQ